MRRRSYGFLVALALMAGSCAQDLPAADARPRSPEWERILDGAKKEGKIVIAIPPANELRKELEPLLKQKFGIDAELVSAPGPRNASRIAAERKAGLSYFDALIVGTGTAV